MENRHRHDGRNSRQRGAARASGFPRQANCEQYRQAGKHRRRQLRGGLPAQSCQDGDQGLVGAGVVRVAEAGQWRQHVAIGVKERFAQVHVDRVIGHRESMKKRWQVELGRITEHDPRRLLGSSCRRGSFAESDPRDLTGREVGGPGLLAPCELKVIDQQRPSRLQLQDESVYILPCGDGRMIP